MFVAKLMSDAVPDSDDDGVNDDDDLCPSTAAGDDVDANGCSDDQVDSDGDGVCDPDAPSEGPSGCTGDDACVDSDLSPSVVIDGCDSEVTNPVLGDGCTFLDLIAECAQDARNHGQFVSCVSRLTNGWRNDGLISGQERGAIQSCAAQADIP